MDAIKTISCPRVLIMQSTINNQVVVSHKYTRCGGLDAGRI